MDEWIVSVTLFSYLSPPDGRESRAVGETTFSPLNLKAAASQSGTSMFSADFPSPQVSLLYPSVNPAVEEPLQISSPQHISPPPEERMFCEVKGINIVLSRRGEKGRTFTFIQLSLQQLSTWLGKFPSHPSMDSPLSKSSFSLADRDWSLEPTIFDVEKQKEVTPRSLTPH